MGRTRQVRVELRAVATPDGLAVGWQTDRRHGVICGGVVEVGQALGELLRREADPMAGAVIIEMVAETSRSIVA